MPYTYTPCGDFVIEKRITKKEKENLRRWGLQVIHSGVVKISQGRDGWWLRYTRCFQPPEAIYTQEKTIYEMHLFKDFPKPNIDEIQSWYFQRREACKGNRSLVNRHGRIGGHVSMSHLLRKLV